MAARPGFGGRGLPARFLYSLPQSLVGHRRPGAPPVPAAVADRYALELHALAASLTRPVDGDGPALLALDQLAGERLLLGFERDLEPRLAAGSGDLAHLAGWAAKLAGFRILQLAEDESAITANPLRRVPPPKRRADPEKVLGQAKRRACTPEEAGRLLASCPLFWWDHALALLGTGLRCGEFAGLRRRRVQLERTPPVFQ